MASRTDSIKTLKEQIVKLQDAEIHLRLKYHNVTQMLNSQKVELAYLESLEKKANGLKEV
jgi:hypothetical protein